MDKGLRFNEGKTRHDLIPVFAQEQYASVLTKGSEKYAPHNRKYDVGYKRIKQLSELV